MIDTRTTPFLWLMYECIFPFRSGVPLDACPFSRFAKALNREADCEHYHDGQCISRAARESARKATENAE